MNKITLENIISALNFKCLSGKSFLENTVKGAYVSDLLSDVMGKAEKNTLWVTSQIHRNIVAVASLKELSAIVIVNERTPSEELIQHAEEENIVILSSGLCTFETTGKIYNFLNP